MKYLKKLPIGISSLAKIRDEHYAYIDKTHHIVNLFNTDGRYYFLSRPRRFGKSLFIDTIKQAFLGKKELFSNLYLEQNWDWDTKYPVLHFDFGGSSSVANYDTLTDIIWLTLEYHAKLYGVIVRKDLTYALAFQELIRGIANRHNTKVVILVDEYDKPILDNILDTTKSSQMREMLKDLYSQIKTNDEYIKFVLLTGVSKFSKVSLFSGLNNLNDITLDKKYADICGYTQFELELEFADYLIDVDKNKLKAWYNGYNFAGKEEQKVYNPFDILLFFSKGCEYRPYWFETATPTFLINLIAKNGYFIPDLEHIVVSDTYLSNFDIDTISVTTLLFQTGYLTIKEITTVGTQYAYVLHYPNLEVKASLNSVLLDIGIDNSEIKVKNIYELSNVLDTNKFDNILNILNKHFALIPHDWYRNNKIANYEGFYASVVYSYFAALGYKLIAEDVTNHGNIDLTLLMPDKILLIEFKLISNGSASDAITQIKNKKYAEKYLADDKPITILGISFDPIDKNVVEVAVENIY